MNKADDEIDDDVHAAVSGNTNLWARSALSTIDLDARLRADLAVESTEIDADDGHVEDDIREGE